jgi:hypothetical protein
MAEEERRFAKPASGKSTIVTIIVLALAGGVVWLLAERNSRQWYLVYEDGALSVKKGVFFPIGKQTFKTDDPAVAEAYAPLKPPAGAKLDEERAFDDRAGLDQALYDLVAKWARDEIATERPDAMQRGLEWVHRAELLPSLSGLQKKDLEQLRAEAGFFEARQLVERAAEGLRQARDRLRLTAGSTSAHAGEANEALRRIDPVVEELYRAGRVLAPMATPGSRTEPQPAPQAAPAPPPAAAQPPAPAQPPAQGATAAAPDAGAR